MKKILSLTLVVMLLVSAIPTAFAAETQDYSLGTAVTVEGAGGEYTVTVPATLNAGQVGTVTAKGYWAKEETLIVTAPETIEVTNVDTNQKATVNVDFDGIESLGDDLEELTKTADISVDKGNTKFGTWTGTIVYNVELVEPPAPTLINFTYQSSTALEAYSGETWGEWIARKPHEIADRMSFSAEDNNALKIDGDYFVVPATGGIQAIYADTVIVEGMRYDRASMLP